MKSARNAPATADSVELERPGNLEHSGARREAAAIWRRPAPKPIGPRLVPHERQTIRSSQRKGSVHGSRINLNPARSDALLHAGLGPRLRLEALAQESWDAVYLGGAHVGYVHTFVEKVQNKGRDYLRVRIDMKQTLKRGRDETVTKLTYGTIETLQGEVLRLDTLTDTGEQRIRTYGDVIGGKMKLIMEVGGAKQEIVIPWGQDIRGPYAAELSMARSPMKEKETRSLRMFMPTLNKICDIELQALKIEPTVMGDATKRDLLHVEQKNPRRRQAPAGVRHPPLGRSRRPGPQTGSRHPGRLRPVPHNQGSRGVSRRRRVQFDLIKGSVIKVKHVIPNPERTRMVRYH